jgi:uncharacterized protein with GYD domain
LGRPNQESAKPYGSRAADHRSPGGKLLSAYYAFGEDDVVLIAELPDNVSAAAFALTVAGGGAAKALETTVLMSVEEGLEAMRRASGTGYRPPGS